MLHSNMQLVLSLLVRLLLLVLLLPSVLLPSLLLGTSIISISITIYAIKGLISDAGMAWEGLLGVNTWMLFLVARASVFTPLCMCLLPCRF